MEENVVEIKNYKDEDIIKIEDILNNLEKYNITTIRISEPYLISRPGKVAKVFETDYEHALRLEDNFLDDGKILSIDEEYFIKNPEKVNQLIKKISKTTSSNKIVIFDKILITPDVLQTLSENDNIKDITLTYESHNKEKEYILTKDDYNIFKKSHIPKKIKTPQVVESLKNNFDPIIGYNVDLYLIGYNKYKNLIDLKQNLNINKELTPEEITNFKFIPNGKNIIINITNFNSIEQILNKIIELKIDAQITINIDNKEKFNQTTLFKENKYDELNLKIATGTSKYSLNDYKNFENILYTFISPIKDKNYSPFEKYIYAYNIAKRFKQYKEVPENNNKMGSRNLYDILMNEYMVCVGYAHMFEDLLTKMGIPCMDKSITVATNKPQEYVEFAGHARVYVHLQDSKYNIDGYYTSDPTWDNDLNKDYYNYMIMTNQEINNDHMKFETTIRNKYGIIDVNSLLESITKEEFFQKINYIINNVLNEYIEQNKGKKFDTKEEVIKIYVIITNKLLEIIKKIDEEGYKKISCKYQIPENEYQKNEEFYYIFPNLITELGNYIVSKTNNKVSGKTIIDAAMVINKDIYNLTDEEAIEFRKNLIDLNKRREEVASPTRTIENHQTGQIMKENSENKFEIEQYQQESGKTK